MSGDVPPITPEQMRAARTLLRMSRERLGALSEITEKFILFYENEGRLMKLRYFHQDADALGAVRIALEAAGVQFTEENDGGTEVRLRMSDGSSD